jgi:EmrB/QacA subfamily drug resistance transporter
LIPIVYVDYHQHMVDPGRWRALPVILAATFLYGFDLNVVNIALASLQRDLHAGSAALELVVGGYAFTYAAGLVTGGRLGDLFGYRRMFTAGMASFAIASLLCGLAQSPGELVGARLLQGLAAAVMVPQVLAMITALFPGEERPRALAWFGVTAGVSGLCGQVLGGLLLSANVLGLSWRAIFFLNVPIGALVLVLASRLVPKVATPAGTRMDPCGVAGISAALALALAPLSLGQQEGWPAWTWACLAASVPVMAAALAREQRLDQRGGQPLIDLSLFGRRSFTAGMAISVAFMACFTSSVFTVSLLLQDGLGLTPLHAGLAFLPMAATGIAGPLIGRRLLPRYGPFQVMLAGSLVNAAGFAALALILQIAGPAVTVIPVSITLAVTGLGNMLILPTVIGVSLTAVGREQAGIASGTLNTTQQFAGSAGIAVIATVFFAGLGHRTHTAGYTHATAAAAWIDLGLTLVITTLSAVLAPRLRPAPAGLPDERSVDQPPSPARP